MKRAALLLRCSTNIQDYNRQKLELEKVASRFKLKVAKVFGEHVTGKDDIRKQEEAMNIDLPADYVVETTEDAGYNLLPDNVEEAIIVE